jgi:hypothetical protein
MTDTKLCASCLQEKPVSEFGKRADSKDGLRYRCRECEAARRPTQSGTKYQRKPADRKLPPWKCQQFQSVELVYRSKLPSEVMPPGWYVRIDKRGYGVPATDTMVYLWREILELRTKVRQLEAR